MRYFLLAFFIACSTLFATPADFTHVAKIATPAVVSIKVKQNSPSAESSFDDFEEFFGPNDLFRHFFNRPHMQREQAPVTGVGSGFIVSPAGLIVTNAHVVQNADEITITLNDEREYTGKVVGSDPNTDIAVIQIDETNLPYLTLANSDALEVGQWVIAIGSPLGLQATLTAGVVSAKGRNNLDIRQIQDFIQTDAAINRGNSGGPLLNLEGEVVGMNTALISPTGGNMGIGFAIPSNMIEHITGQIRETGVVTRGFVGVMLQPVDQDLAKAFNLDTTRGVLIAEVQSDSPAAKAGLQQGDVIVKYNSTQVVNIGALRNAISLMTPGTTATLTVIRNNQPQEIAITIGEFPGSRQEAASEVGAIGIHVETLTPDMASRTGIAEGVVVNRVEPGSVAAFAGIQKGAIILEVNRQKVTSLDAFIGALKTSSTGRPVLLLIKQGDLTRYVSLKAN